MRARSGLGFLAAAVLGGGCLQALGYEEPTLVATGSGGSEGGTAAHCTNATKDGDETGVDCGGTCSPCKDGDGCKVGPDCQSLVCEGGTYLAPACDDKAKNGSETDVDCGGMTCPVCPTGKECRDATDCKSGMCAGGVCGASCSDGAKNGGETGSDCGGPCAPCNNGDGCATGTDRESGVCQSVVCVDSFVWAQRFGGTDTAMASASDGRGVALDATGSIVLVGALGDTVDFGGGPLKSAGQQDVFVAKFGATGNHLWSKRFGDDFQQLATSVAIDQPGNVVVGGFYNGSINFGIAGHSWEGGISDGFITKLSSSGNEQWTVAAAGPALEVCASVAVDSGGNIFATGYFTNTVTFNFTTLTTTGGLDIFLVTLAPDGFVSWAKSFGDSNLQAGLSIAVDGSGNVVLATRSTGPPSFGGATLPNAGGNDLYIAKFDTNGSPLWSKQFGGTDEQDVINLTTDSTGNVKRHRCWRLQRLG